MVLMDFPKNALDIFYILDNPDSINTPSGTLRNGAGILEVPIPRLLLDTLESNLGST